MIMHHLHATDNFGNSLRAPTNQTGRKHKVKVYQVLAAVCSAFGLALALAATASCRYAWGWGAGGPGNCEFHSQRQYETLNYGARFRANWTGEIRDAMLASNAATPSQARVDESVDTPEVDN
jgi:hypothetical protein